jgi:hypothetical protein
LQVQGEDGSVEPGETVEEQLHSLSLDGFAPVGFACLFLGFMVVCFIQFLKFSACRFEVHSLHKVPEGVLHVSFINAPEIDVVNKVARILRPSFGNAEEF